MEKSWESSIDTLFKTQNTKTCVLLKEAGFEIVKDLLLIFPSKISRIVRHHLGLGG